MIKKTWVPIALALAIIVCAAAVVATPADAARGGKRGGGSGTTPVTGGCTVNPNPVAVATDFTVSGTGAPGQYVTVVVVSATGTGYRWAQANSSGAWSVVSRVFSTGSNSVKVHDSITSAQIGSCSFSSY